jgi:hypothetical protein
LLQDRRVDQGLSLDWSVMLVEPGLEAQAVASSGNFGA